MKCRSQLLILLVIFSLLFNSCKKDDSINVSTPEIELRNSLTERVDINITCNTSWRIETIYDWIGYSTRTGEGNQTISIFVRSLNMEEISRSGSLTFVAGSSRDASVTIPVKQLASSIDIVDKPDNLDFTFSGGEKELYIKSGGDWRVSVEGNRNAEFEITPLSGTGDGKIVIKCLPKNIRKDESFLLKIISANKSEEIGITVIGLPNTSPNTPILSNPINSRIDVEPYKEEFSWSCSDPDGDKLVYTIHISEDKYSWTELDVKSATSISALELGLSPLTKYYWKVSADDGNDKDNSVSYSEVFVFSTLKPEYAIEDGEYIIHYKSPRPKSVKILFMGDGYIASDFLPDGKFETDVNEAIEAFFSIEPYKTYKDYFTIYKMANYSRESGANRLDLGKTVDNAFGSTIAGAGSTSVTCDYNKVFKSATTIPDIDSETLCDMHIALIINENIYAGTCIIFSDGRSIGMNPASRSNTYGEMGKLENIVRHESGGHGWGRLADEYVTNETSITEEDAAKLRQWHTYGFHLNVSLFNDLSKVPWRDFANRIEYPRVNLFAGGFYYKGGIWRSEETSCMINNIPYYTVWQRYLQVKRIMDVLDEEFDINKFMERDIQDYPTSLMNLGTKVPLKSFVPLGPPILID